MNKQILFLLVLLFVTYASAGYGCPYNEQACRNYCITQIMRNNGERPIDGECGGLLNFVCQCIY